MKAKPSKVTTSFTPLETRLMASALSLASRAVGQVAPNPAVGCLLTDPEGRTIARGWTQPGGRPHAEAEAISNARAQGASLKGAHAYVTLEPCAHKGQTPPCADALIEAGIARVVIACTDPDLRVNGEGIRKLEQAGIEVRTGLFESDAKALNGGFLTRQKEGRPLVALKLATSLDGCIATASGHSQWITGETARAYGHLLRAQHDAVLTGMGTVHADDPQLTCRLPGFEEHQPVRIVIDTYARLPSASKLLATTHQAPLWVITGPDAEDLDIIRLQKEGAQVLRAPYAAHGRVDLAAVMSTLGAQGLNRVLVEAGGKLSGALVRANLADRLYWFRAPLVIGGDGIAALDGLELDKVTAAPRYRATGKRVFGEDVLETYDAQLY